MLTRTLVLMLALAAGAQAQTISNGEQVLPYSSTLTLNASYISAFVTLTGNVSTINVATGSFGGESYHLTLCQGSGGPYTAPASWSNTVGATTIATTGCTRFRLVWDDPADTWVSTIEGTGATPNTVSSPLAITGNNIAFSTQTANAVLAAPNGASGTPGFRTLVAADIPTLNQSTTGQAGTVATISGLVTASNGINVSGSGTTASPYAVAPTVLNGAGTGFFISDGHLSMGGIYYSATGTAMGTANRVYVTQFVLTAPMTLGHASLSVSGGSSGSSMNLGIYSSTGSKLLDSGAISSATSSSTPNASFGQVTLQPGVYYLAWAATSTSPTFVPLTTPGSLIPVNSVSTKSGYAANALSGGSLPSALGTVTASAVTIPYCVFEY